MRPRRRHKNNVTDSFSVAVVLEILNRDHVLEDCRLTVAPYYECLGPLPPGMGTEPCWTPPDITVNADSRVVQFLARSDTMRSRFESGLDDVSPGCTITWPESASSDSGRVVVSFSAASRVVSGTAVSKACRDRLAELLGTMDAGSVEVLREMWPLFLERWQSAEVDESVSVRPDPENCRVLVVGEREKCSETVAGLGRLRAELVDELQRSRARISETVRTNSPLQLSLLQTCGLLQTESADELSLTVVDGEVTVAGQAEKVARQQMRMYELLASAHSEKVRVDGYVLAVLKLEPFRRHVDQLLQPVTGVVWRLAGKEIEVYGIDKDKVGDNCNYFYFCLFVLYLIVFFLL